MACEGEGVHVVCRLQEGGRCHVVYLGEVFPFVVCW